MDDTTDMAPQLDSAAIHPSDGVEGELGKKVPENDSQSTLQHTAKPVSEPVQEDGILDKTAPVQARNIPTVVPSHGHGRLMAPGWPNGIPPVSQGSGPSPTARLRDAMRKGLQDMLPGMIARYKSGGINELQFADFLAKYSIGATGTVTHISPDVVSRLERQAMLVASRPSWESRELLLLMRDVWA